MTWERLHGQKYHKWSNVDMTILLFPGEIAHSTLLVVAHHFGNLVVEE